MVERGERPPQRPETQDVCEVTGNFAFYDTRVEVEPAPSDVDTSKYERPAERDSGASEPVGEMGWRGTTKAAYTSPKTMLGTRV